MQKSFFPGFLFAMLFFSATAQTGKVIEKKTINSSVLGRSVNYTVYLPADYDKSERTYPVVYLLHGYTDDNTGWLQFGEINRYADKAIADGTIPPMIIVMPDADTSWYINTYDGKEKYEDFFINEFIPAVEKEFHIKGTKKFRAVAGLSMGGYGTMVYALKHPDLFAAAAPFSAGIFTDEQLTVLPAADYDHVVGPLYGRHLTGKARLTAAWKSYSVLDLVNRLPVESLTWSRRWTTPATGAVSTLRFRD